MQTNAVPYYDQSVNTTGCCPKFNPDGWDDRHLKFKDKSFVRATTRSAMHVPLNMGSVFDRVHRHIEDAGGYEADNVIVLSRDLSAWSAEHLFSHDAPVEGEEMTTLNGNFVTKVFQGPYKHAKEWHDLMINLAREEGGTKDEVYFFYTTCPKCAKAYGENYVIGVARTD